MSENVAQNLLYGAAVTLSLVLLCWIIAAPVSTAVGFLLGLAGRRRELTLAARLVSSIPFICILFWAYYPLQEILGVVWSGYLTTLALMIVVVSLILSSIVADAVNLVNSRFLEVAQTLAISRYPYITSVLFPLVIRAAFPRALTLLITSIHLTMFGSLIGVEELFRITMRLNADLLRPVQLYSIMALMYAAICVPIYLLADKLGRDFDRRFPED